MRYTLLSALLALALLSCGGHSVSPIRPQTSGPPSSGSNSDHDDDGSSVQVCEKGTMVGFWVRDAIFAYSGYFGGLWLSDEGDTISYFNGTSWQEDWITLRFEGQVTGYVTDEVIANLYGTWFYDDPRMCPMCGTGHGQFHGRTVYLAGGYGKIYGEFGDYSLPLEENELPLTGVWHRYLYADQAL